MDNLHAEAKVRFFSPESKEKKVLMVLALKGDPDGTNIWCSVETVALHLGVSPRTVQRHLRELEKRGELVTKIMGSGHRSNLYFIPICRSVDNLDSRIVSNRIRLLQDNLFSVTEKEFVVPVTTKGDNIVTQPIKDLNNWSGDSDSATLFSEQKSNSFKVDEFGMSEETRKLFEETMFEIEESIALDARSASRTIPGYIGVAEFEIVAPA